VRLVTPVPYVNPGPGRTADDRSRVCGPCRGIGRAGGQQNARAVVIRCSR